MADFEADRFRSHPGKPEKPELPRRFYKDVEVAGAEGGYSLFLDGRAIRTPAKAHLVLPTQGLAEGLAEEWRAQETHIDPHSMPLTRLANSAIDRVLPNRRLVVEEVAGYAGSDLLCYLADAPAELAERQRTAWTPLLAWAQEAHGLSLQQTSGLMPIDQAPEEIEKLKALLDGKDGFWLAAFASAVTLSGSAIIALAMGHAQLTGEEAFRTAHIDESWQAELWGADSEEEARLEARRRELIAAERFFDLIR